MNSQLSYRFWWGPKRCKANKEWTATAVECRVNHYGIRWRYNANIMVRSWVHNIHGVTRSHIHKLTISCESSGSGMRPETKKCFKMFIKIQKKAASFLRVSVGRKPLELTQGHGENVLPERWILRLSVVERKSQCQALVKENITTCELDTTWRGVWKKMLPLQIRGRKLSV